MLFWQWCLPHRLHMLSLTFGNPSTCTVPLMHWSCHFFHGFCCISPALFCPYYCLAFPRFATSSPHDIRIRFVSHTRHVHFISTMGRLVLVPQRFFARDRELLTAKKNYKVAWVSSVSGEKGKDGSVSDLLSPSPLGRVVSKTKHSKTKTEARSTQISKTKHPKLENEAP